MILWNEQFATGSETIDQQHRMLIYNINHLECMLENNNPTAAECEFLIHLISFLETYTVKHFQFEEGCMERFRCPAHAKNKQAHEQFMMFFQRFKERSLAEGFRQDVIRTLHQTISLWIQEHIVKVDTQLKPCLKNAPADRA